MFLRAAPQRGGQHPSSPHGPHKTGGEGFASGSGTVILRSVCNHFSDVPRRSLGPHLRGGGSGQRAPRPALPGPCNGTGPPAIPLKSGAQGHRGNGPVVHGGGGAGGDRWGSPPWLSHRRVALPTDCNRRFVFDRSPTRRRGSPGGEGGPPSPHAHTPDGLPRRGLRAVGGPGLWHLWRWTAGSIDHPKLPLRHFCPQFRK